MFILSTNVSLYLLVNPKEAIWQMIWPKNASIVCYVKAGNFAFMSKNNAVKNQVNFLWIPAWSSDSFLQHESQDYRLYDDKCCCWPFVIPAINWGSNQVILCRNGWNNLRFYPTAATNSLFSYTWNEGQFWEIWKKISLNCNSLFKKWQKVSLAKQTIFLVWSKQGMQDRVQPSPSLKFCKDFS